MPGASSSPWPTSRRTPGAKPPARRRFPYRRSRSRSCAASTRCSALSHWPRIDGFRGAQSHQRAPKSLISRSAAHERAAPLTSKTRERDNADQVTVLPECSRNQCSAVARSPSTLARAAARSDIFVYFPCVTHESAVAIILDAVPRCRLSFRQCSPDIICLTKSNRQPTAVTMIPAMDDVQQS